MGPAGNGGASSVRRRMPHSEHGVMPPVTPPHYFRWMPRISTFYGIVIVMFWNDHDPPHFHATYGEYRAQISIWSGEEMGGRLPNRAKRLVKQWADLHRGELLANWRKAQAGLPLDKIDPLP